MATCGDFGGVNEDGSSCSRRAGWGVRPKTEDGQCKVHAVKDEVDEQLKADFLAAYDDGFRTVRAVCHELGISEAKVWKLRHLDDDFDKQFQEKRLQADELRNSAVEDSLFARIIKGNASAAETIFWLVNRSSRWKHVQHVRHGIDEDAPLTGVVLVPAELTAEEWAAKYSNET